MYEARELESFGLITHGLDLAQKVLAAQAVSCKESRLPMKLRLGYFHIRLLLS